MALERFAVRPVSRDLAMDMVVRHHYLHRAAPCSVAFGLFDGDSVCGVVCYGTPSSAPLRSGIAGPEYCNDVVELTRLWIDDAVPRNGESYLIGNTVGRAGKLIVVSFAEPDQGHVGTVYQATNWIYTGLSAKRTDWTIDGLVDDSEATDLFGERPPRALHGQTIADRFTAAEIRARFGDRFAIKPRPRKHRYLFINARGARRRQILAALRYPVLPYPKRLVAAA